MRDREQEARDRMVRDQLEARGIRDERVLAVMRRVPRHLFVPEPWRENAYDDRPQPIGENQTISQPLMVALMTELLDLRGGETVLELGTGSGYQTAVLAEMCERVVSIERHVPLAEQAKRVLTSLSYANIEIHVADGTLGWPADAPYPSIVVTAGAPSVPPPLVEQLAPGGRLVVPVGDREMQTLTRICKDAAGRTSWSEHGRCVFVPVVGQHGWREERWDPDA
ncbi:MAG TPA: protein-L-isoaspartate(D-aspartate) O-methyltransferase [Chthonomonadales bacterium]|nr:protein-L-isoaspartate(D-aspartate) O-methyltransferase [Chthonomonadales bacterium]